MNVPGGERSGTFNIVVVAASAGGVQALSVLAGALPADFPVPVLIVQHLDPDHETTLAAILDRRAAVRFKLAESGEKAARGVAYVAPPDHHLLVDEDGILSLSHSARTHFVRPSADVLFESVALAYGPRAIVCVLTGTGRDGALGAQAVRSRGGKVIVEDPGTAAFTGMPKAAVEAGPVDLVLRLQEIPTALNNLLVANQP